MFGWKPQCRYCKLCAVHPVSYLGRTYCLVCAIVIITSHFHNHHRGH